MIDEPFCSSGSTVCRYRRGPDDINDVLLIFVNG
jgi:hypothetical protein